MVTVESPSGSPTVVYNRDGVTIASISASGSVQGGAVISAPSVQTVVIVSCDTNDFAATLPSSPDVGNVVEAYCDVASTHALNLFPASGAHIGAAGTNSEIAVDPGKGVLVRYVGSSAWLPIGQYS